MEGKVYIFDLVDKKEMLTCLDAATGKQGRADAINSFNKPDYEKFEPEAIIIED